MTSMMTSSSADKSVPQAQTPKKVKQRKGIGCLMLHSVLFLFQQPVLYPICMSAFSVPFSKVKWIEQQPKQ